MRLHIRNVIILSAVDGKCDARLVGRRSERRDAAYKDLEAFTAASVVTITHHQTFHNTKRTSTVWNYRETTGAPRDKGEWSFFFPNKLGWIKPKAEFIFKNVVSSIKVYKNIIKQFYLISLMVLPIYTRWTKMVL